MGARVLISERWYNSPPPIFGDGRLIDYRINIETLRRDLSAMLLHKSVCDLTTQRVCNPVPGAPQPERILVMTEGSLGATSLDNPLESHKTEVIQLILMAFSDRLPGGFSKP